MGKRMNGFIITQFPTKETMEEAHKTRSMILSFIVQPESVTTSSTAKAFQTGWLMGRGLEPDYRLALILVPREVDFQEYVNKYMKDLSESTKRMQSFLKVDE